MNNGLYINDVFVNSDFKITSCVHEMYAGGYSDFVKIQIYDSKNVFKGYKISNVDQIAYKHNFINTGNMHLLDYKEYSNHSIELLGVSMPVGLRQERTKAWKNVRLFQICEDIATRHGLKFENYMVSDVWYDYVLQNNELDFKFLGYLAVKECCFVSVNNGILSLVNEIELEKNSMKDKVKIDLSYAQVEFISNKNLKIGSVKVVSGMYLGVYSIDESLKQKTIALPATSNAEATRYAKGILKSENNKIESGYCKFNTLQIHIKVGLCFDFNEKNAYIYRIRHDYVKNKTDMYFRIIEQEEY